MTREEEAIQKMIVALAAGLAPAAKPSIGPMYPPTPIDGETYLAVRILRQFVDPEGNLSGPALTDALIRAVMHHAPQLPPAPQPGGTKPQPGT